MLFLCWALLICSFWFQQDLDKRLVLTVRPSWNYMAVWTRLHGIQLQFYLRVCRFERLPGTPLLLKQIR